MNRYQQGVKGYRYGMTATMSTPSPLPLLDHQVVLGALRKKASLMNRGMAAFDNDMAHQLHPIKNGVIAQMTGFTATRSFALCPMIGRLPVGRGTQRCTTYSCASP